MRASRQRYLDSLNEGNVQAVQSSDPSSLTPEDRLTSLDVHCLHQDAEGINPHVKEIVDLCVKSVLAQRGVESARIPIFYERSPDSLSAGYYFPALQCIMINTSAFDRNPEQYTAHLISTITHEIDHFHQHVVEGKDLKRYDLSTDEGIDQYFADENEERAFKTGKAYTMAIFGSEDRSIARGRYTLPEGAEHEAARFIPQRLRDLAHTPITYVKELALLPEPEKGWDLEAHPLAQLIRAGSTPEYLDESALGLLRNYGLDLKDSDEIDPEARARDYAYRIGRIEVMKRTFEETGGEKFRLGSETWERVQRAQMEHAKYLIASVGMDEKDPRIQSYLMGLSDGQAVAFHTMHLSEGWVERRSKIDRELWEKSKKSPYFSLDGSEKVKQERVASILEKSDGVIHGYQNGEMDYDNIIPLTERAAFYDLVQEDRYPNWDLQPSASIYGYTKNRQQQKNREQTAEVEITADAGISSPARKGI